MSHGFVPEDTDPEAWEMQADVLRRLGGAARLARVFALNERARELAVAGIRRRHPEYTDAQVHAAWLRLKLGDAIARAVWPGRLLVDP